MNKILIICGPTATGKTNLGIKLAKKFNGEIVSADSRQVYKGMDIITGKDFQVMTKGKGQMVKVWMLDIVVPNEKFNVADYHKYAWRIIKDIWQRGKLPIIVGGTGFYIKTLLEGIGTMGIEPDWELRNELQKKTVPDLVKLLENLDPERSRRMNESDRKNPRRLIRAIEVANEIRSQTPNTKYQINRVKLNKLIIGLKAPYKELYKKIDERIRERVRAGAEKEIEKLLEKGYSWEDSVLGTTIGYRQWREYFEGKSSVEKVIENWKFAEHNYCHRQMTWFKKMPEIEWFDIVKDNWQKQVEKLVGNWYI